MSCGVMFDVLLCRLVVSCFDVLWCHALMSCASCFDVLWRHVCLDNVMRFVFVFICVLLCLALKKCERIKFVCRRN
jgi:hypothetical protein